MLRVHLRYSNSASSIGMSRRRNLALVAVITVMHASLRRKRRFGFGRRLLHDEPKPAFVQYNCANICHMLRYLAVLAGQKSFCECYVRFSLHMYKTEQFGATVCAFAHADVCGSSFVNMCLMAWRYKG
ncbi:hypothetical protein J6590_016354 [Homalodisca vitripennis]|nr:hypothetical protein J6590_016354 [Homalodisca vitripennis]